MKWILHKVVWAKKWWSFKPDPKLNAKCGKSFLFFIFKVSKRQMRYPYIILTFFISNARGWRLTDYHFFCLILKYFFILCQKVNKKRSEYVFQYCVQATWSFRVSLGSWFIRNFRCTIFCYKLFLLWFETSKFNKYNFH